MGNRNDAICFAVGLLVALAPPLACGGDTQESASDAALNEAGVICGSLQEKSANLTLLNTAVASAPEDVEVVVFDGLRQLPHFDPDIEARGEPPPAVRAWRRALAESDALLIASPEYGHSLPGALKNGIDWVIGSGELERKVVAITSAVPAAERGLRGLQALRQALGAVSARIVGGRRIARNAAFENNVRDLVHALIEEARAPLDD